MRVNILLKYFIIISLFCLWTIGCGEQSSQPHPSRSLSYNGIDLKTIAPEQLAKIGEFIIFGMQKPQSVPGTVPIGKGLCPLCHKFFKEQPEGDRAPSLFGVVARAEVRIKEDRYQMFLGEYEKTGEPLSGIKPHAKTGGEYLIESLYCPNCYVVIGQGVKGTQDMESPEPRANKPPLSLTDFEIVAVIAYLEYWDSDLNSKITAIEDWEHYFGKKLTVSASP